MAEYVNPSVLISDEELEAKLGDPSIRVVEVDEDTSLYGKGHIPGAIAWNWKTELHDPLRRDFIDQKQLAALLKKSGVGPDTTVVLYAGNNNWFSAYTYWLLRYLGFDNVKLLNGGRKKWELESRQLTSDVLKELYANAGVSGDKPIIAYCRIGERSSHSWFVLTELLGYDNVKNYDGSWTEYGSLVGVPVER